MDAKKRARERAIFKAAELRHDALVRSGGTCEACGLSDAVHLHHLIGGTGRRRQQERLETVAMVCLTCHGDIHRNDWVTLRSLQFWAESRGYREAQRELTRRIDKIETPLATFRRLADKARAR